MRLLFCLPLFCVGLAAQGPGDADLMRLTRELRGAVGTDSLAAAAAVADKLDEAVQRRYQNWLVRDADQRVNDVLTWLPPDIEGFWVNQEPFTIKPQESLQLLYGRPIQAYSMDRLIALNGGTFQRALGNRTVRLVAAAARNIRTEKDGVAIPGLAGSQDVAYFYFFAGAIDLPPVDETLQGQSAWRATAKILAGLGHQPGVEPEQKEDENWLVLARPDLLVLSNRRELLVQILESMTGGAKARAMPATLPEWVHVDRTSSFWGLRHYSAQSKPTREQRGYGAAELPSPDGAATGVTVRFDEAKQRLEIHYLSAGPLTQNSVYANDRQREFQVDQPEAGVWRLISDVQARGAYPVHFAMTMLGFGEYR
jgi:hypothetical protein